MNFLLLSKLRMVSLRAAQYYVTLFRVLIDHNPAGFKQREENNSIFLQRYEISLPSLYLNHMISCFNRRCSDQSFVLFPYPKYSTLSLLVSPFLVRSLPPRLFRVAEYLGRLKSERTC